MTARALEDRKTVFAGVGIPLVAARLAQKTHAPNISIMMEGGIIGANLKPGVVPLSTNEARGARRAKALCSIADIFLYQQRGFIDYGMVGGSQIDKYGNLNTSIIGVVDKPRARLPGGGGGNDIMSSASRLIITMPHEKKRFVEKVDFVTSPGYLTGDDSRERAGLIFGGPSKVVTNLAILGFDERSKRMRVVALHFGTSLEDVLANTSFELIVPKDIPVISPPTDEELTAVREIDPHKEMLGN